MNSTEPQRIKKGRPRTLGIIIEDNYCVKDYNKSYYEMVYKEKMKGEYVCEICNVICSKANRSRHNKSKLHLNNMDIIN